MREVVTAARDASAAEVARLMRNAHVGDVVVVDELDGRRIPCGIVTDRDVCMGAYINGRALQDLLVSTCMQRELHTCRAEDGIDHALGLMAERQIRRLPVVTADGKLAGTISLADAARAAAGVKEARGRRLLAEAVSLALAAITAPRFQEREVEKVVELEPAPAPAKKAPSAPEKSSRSSTKRR
jgi:CBS domain-containing protein